MASGQQRIDKLGETDFRGKVGKNVTAYAKELQRLSRDLAAEFDNGATAADAAIRKLGKRHKLLLGTDIRLRARLVSRRLRRARDSALGVSAEAVKFQAEYRRQFLGVDDSGKKRGRGEVDF